MTAKFFEYQVNFTAPGWRFRGAPTRRYPADSNLAFWQKSANLQNHLDIARMAVPRSAQRDDIPPTTGLRNRRTFQILSYFYNARMAELADALDSKSCSRKGVRVRPPLRAPIDYQLVTHLKSSKPVAKKLRLIPFLILSVFPNRRFQ